LVVRKQTLRFFVVLYALQLFWLGAQTTTTGAVSGTLTDSSGAVIPNTPVTLASNATGSTQTGSTNSAGAFQFSLLQPGSYTLTVSAPGFNKIMQQISVELGQVTATDLKLSVSGSQQAINVTSEAPLLQTENGNVANTITQQQIRQVPNPGNDMTFVLNITPGAVTNGTTRTLFGLPNSSSLYTINGMDSNDPYYNGNSSGATNLLLGGSEVMEASVAGNAYSGQFGGLAGAQVNYVTRSGSNEYHGSATYYWTGRTMNANSWFNNAQGVARPFTNANQWAAGFGGPIKKNKLFFYGNTEGLRVILPTSSLVLAPSVPFQQATLSNLLARGLSASVPFYQQMFALYNGAPGITSAKPGNSSDPLGCNGFTGPNGLGTTLPCAVNFRSTVVNFAQEWNLATRVDYNLSDNDRFFIRFATDHGLQPTLTDPINSIFNAVSSQPSYTGQVNETHTFGTHGVNNLILSGGWYGAAFGPVNLAATLQAFPTQLTFADGSFSTLGGGNGTYPVFRNVSMAQAQDDLVFYQGKHTLKTGIKWRGNRVNDGYFTRGTHGTLTPGSLGAFFNGGTDPSSGGKQTVYSQNFSTTANHQMQYWQIGGYVEDEWHAMPNLTLTASLRIDHASIPVCTDGCFARPVQSFLQLNHDPTVPYNQALLTNQESSLPGLQNLQWQPRAGFAWQPSGSSSGFVIRGGAGIFFDAFPAVILDLLSLTPPGFNSFTVSGDNLALTQPSNLISDAGILNSNFLNGFYGGKTAAQIRASLPASLQPYYKAPGISSSDNEVKIYQVYKWNFEVQKSLGRDTTVSVNYVGNHGIHKPFPNVGLNAYSSTFGGLPTTVPDARFGQIYYLQSDGLSSYNGMITSLRTRIRGNGVVQASYTWSHSLDSLSGGLTRTLTAGSDINSAVNPYNPNATYTTSANDIRHYFMTNYVYTTPYRNPFLHGWQLSGTIFTHSGSPFTVTDNSTSSALSSTYFGGTVLARYIGGATNNCSTPSQACLLKSQFASAASVSSNLGRNVFRGPAYFDTDLAVMKQIPVPHWEAAALNVGFQFFNLFNHPNFANPTNNFSSSTFGRITSTVGTPTSIFGSVGGDSSARIIQVKANFTF
jgi:hypothetical protein